MRSKWDSVVAWALAGALSVGSSALGQSSGGGGGGAAGGGAGAAAGGAVGGIGGVAGRAGPVGTGSTSPGLSAGTGSFRGNNFQGNVGTVNGLAPGVGTAFGGGFAPGVGTVGTAVSVPSPGVLTVPGVGTATGLDGGIVNGANLVGLNGNVLGMTGVVGVNPLTGAPVVAPIGTAVAPGTASPLLLNALQNAALQNNVVGQRFLTRSSMSALRRSRAAAAGTLGVSRFARTPTGLNGGVRSNLNALGFTGGRPVTLTGELQNVQGFFNGTPVVPTLQGTPISNIATTNLSGASLGQALNSSGSLGAVGIPQTVTGRRTAVAPNRRRGAGVLTGLNTGVTGASFDNFGTGITNLTPTGGVVGTTAFGTPAQPGIDTGTALVGANQVGLTGNTLAAVNPAAAGLGAIQSQLPLQTATGGFGNLMFMQTSSGPILVANPSGLPVGQGLGNLQLQGQLFQRGPFRLLVLNNASAFPAAGVNNFNVAAGGIP